jgi:hypothetical protein
LFKTEDPLMNDPHAPGVIVETADESGGEDLAQLLRASVAAAAVFSAARPQIVGVVVGTLVGFADGGASPLVAYQDQPGTAALPARATVDLHGAHIGKQAVLMFEEGDPYRPIIVGCLQSENTTPLAPASGQVEVDADGDRLVVTAKERIVLRCGKASITLTKEGKLILQGAYVSSQSSGVLRIKGGSVQIN